jgi:Outer membrane protein beta-barrel domain
MKRSLFALALMGIAFVPFAAHAQLSAAKPVSIGVAGGASLPTSDLSDAAETGWNVTGTVGFNPTMIPLGIRVDAAYNRYSVKAPFTGHLAITSVSGNLLYKFPSATVSPYAIGGAGWCHEDASVTGASGSENHFCWNAGGGISMPLSGFETFVEARYNQVQENGGTSKFIPITFGVMF